MVGRRGGSSSVLAAAKLVALGALSVSVRGHSIGEQAHHGQHHRVLQATSSVDYLVADEGTPIPTDDGQVDAVALQVIKDDVAVRTNMKQSHAGLRLLGCLSLYRQESPSPSPRRARIGSAGGTRLLYPSV